MKDLPLEFYNEHVMGQLRAGKRILFGIRKYSGNRAEIVQYDLLLAKDIYTAIILEDIPEQIQRDFPAGSIIWLNIDNDAKQWRITEATELDDLARKQTIEMQQKMERDVSILDTPYQEGQNRVNSLKWKN